MTTLLEADAATGFATGLDLLPMALAATRQRLLRVCDNLDAADWQAQSRCVLWSVHDVVRHVRDVSRIHVAGLRREPTPFSAGQPFSSQGTPLLWLEESTGETPQQTMTELPASWATEEVALDARLAADEDEVVPGPYGEVHWTILSAHVFWDTWLHTRDVTEVVGVADESTPVEEALAGLYGLLVTSVVALLLQHQFRARVRLAGGGGRTYAAAVVPGRVELGAGAISDDADLHGELAAVVDALAGRGPEVDAVLHGKPKVREPFTWLRPILLAGES